MQLAALLLAFTLPAAGEENVTPVDRDLAQLEGSWEMSGEREGVKVRVVKEIAGRRETVRTYRDGKLVHEHAVDFELEHVGGARIFRWKNGEILDGPRKGQEMPDGAFLYRLTDEKWTGVFGLLDGDDRPVFREVYERKK